MVTTLITLLVGAVVLYAVYLILGMFKLPTPIMQIVYVILALIIIL